MHIKRFIGALYLILSAVHCAPPQVMLVESVPVETPLGFDDVPDTHEVWLEMLSSAQTSIDLSQFYISNRAGSRMEPVLAAIEGAAARGVTVRVLVDSVFAEKYPDSLSRLSKVATVRRWDVSQSLGGVQHAKYFVVDGRDAYVGSANFDWRALEHIHELGVRVRSEALCAALGSVFEHDWKTAAGEPAPEPAPVGGGGVWREWPTIVVGSPHRGFPDGGWELPQLQRLIAFAKTSIVIQLLSYDAAYRDGRPYDELDRVLRQAASRGVAIRIVVGDWHKDKDEALRKLSALDNIEVRWATIPVHSSGEIPFARVVHAKYMVVDDQRTWIGSSNWKGDYFESSRNVGLIIDGTEVTLQLARAFEQVWAFTR